MESIPALSGARVYSAGFNQTSTSFNCSNVSLWREGQIKDPHIKVVFNIRLLSIFITLLAR